MRILLVNTLYYPDLIGGTESFMLSLAEKLAENNEVVVLCFAKEHLKSVNGVKIQSIDCRQYEWFVNSKSTIRDRIGRYVANNYNYSISNRIVNIIEEFCPDVIHTNNLYGISTIVWKIANSYRIPLVHTVHDVWLLNDSFTVKNLFYLCNRLLCRKYSSYINKVVSPSKFIEDKVVLSHNITNSNVVVVPHGVQKSDIDIDLLLNEKKSRKDKYIRFMYAGRLDEEKGILQLIDAFESCRELPVILDVFGDGSLKERVQLKCSSSSTVFYHGKIERELLNSEYNNHDVVCVPSIVTESFGLVVIEGIMHGCAILGSDRGALSELIVGNSIGTIINPLNVSSIISGIEYMSDVNNIHRFLDNISEALIKYDIENMVNKYQDIYEEVVEDNRG